MKKIVLSVALIVASFGAGAACVHQLKSKVIGYRINGSAVVLKFRDGSGVGLEATSGSWLGAANAVCGNHCAVTVKDDICDGDSKAIQVYGQWLDVDNADPIDKVAW